MGEIALVARMSAGCAFSGELGGGAEASALFGKMQIWGGRKAGARTFGGNADETGRVLGPSLRKTQKSAIGTVTYLFLAHAHTKKSFFFSLRFPSAT